MINIKSVIVSRKALVLFDQGIFSGMSFLLNILMAHLLTSTDFGLFSSFILLNYLLISVTNSLVINPLQINLSGVEKKEEYVLFSFLFQLFLTIILLLTIQLLFLLPFLNNFIHLKSPLLVFSFAFLFHDYFRKLFLAKEDLKSTLYIDILQLVSQISILAILYRNNVHSLDSYLYGLSLGYFPGFLLAVSKIRFRNYTLVFFKLHVITHLQQGSWLLYTAFLQWTSGNFFTMVSGMYLGLEALGAFRLVQSLFGLLNIVLQTFENYALPIASRLQIISNKKSRAYINKITLQASYLFIPVLLLLFIFSEKAITVFGGAKYLEYSYVVKLMALLYLLIYFGYPLRMFIRLTKKNQFVFVGYFLSFLFSLCTFHFFLKHWSLTGAVIGLMTNQLLLMVYWKYILTVKKSYHGNHTHCSGKSEP